ncbi:calcineurin subunit B [Candida albicans]
MSIHNYTTPNRILYYNYQYIRLQQLSTKMGANASILDGFIEDTNFSIEEIDRLRKRFMKLDKDGSGQIDKQEFLSIPGISSNPLATRLMDVFDKDGDGSIDFEEFITGLSAFSGKSDNLNKLRFAFNIYDIDRDGYIGNGELFIVMKMMVGKNLKDEELQQIVDKTLMEADLDGDGKLNFEEFKNAVNTDTIANTLTLNMF